MIPQELDPDCLGLCVLFPRLMQLGAQGPAAVMLRLLQQHRIQGLLGVIQLPFRIIDER